MNDRTLLGAGTTGAVIAAVCCFTPVLAILLPTIGLAAWLAWADYVFLPLLILCIAMAGIAALRLRRRGTAP